MTTDVSFVSGATTYEFMLAEDENGQKKWAVTQLFSQPPSLLKNRIEATLKAAPSVRQSDDEVTELKTIALVKAELRTLIDVSNITLTGLDGLTYYVTFDATATNIRSIIDTTGRIVEYEIDIACWDLYQP